MSHYILSVEWVEVVLSGMGEELSVGVKLRPFVCLLNDTSLKKRWTLRRPSP